jgi:hypothetical protein
MKTNHMTILNHFSSVCIFTAFSCFLSEFHLAALHDVLPLKLVTVIMQVSIFPGLDGET